MKKFLITFLGIAFLLPALASAGSYCVSFPTTGNNGWTKRDNDIGVRFQYTYDYPAAAGAGFNVPHLYHKSFEERSRSSGALKGSMANSVQKDYTTYDYGTRDLCVYNNAPDFGKITGTSAYTANDGSTNHHYIDGYVPFSQIYLDIRWAGDCAKVNLNGDGDVIGDHKFEIYRRNGDIVNPFNCKKK